MPDNNLINKNNESRSRDPEKQENDYKTPQKYKKQIRQRTHDLSKSLPRSPGLQTAVIGPIPTCFWEAPSAVGACASFFGSGIRASSVQYFDR